MKHKSFGRPRLAWGLVYAALLGTLATAHAQAEDKPDLRSLIEQQAQAIEDMKRQHAQEIEELKRQIANPPAAPAAGAPAPGKLVIDDSSIKKIVADYLQENPGAGMPPSVQVGYGLGGGPGFGIRSAPAAKYVNWNDESRIPFDLNIRVRIQPAYYGYKVTDTLNHMTGAKVAPALGDLSDLQIHRAQLFFTGTAFTPDLRYHLRLHGDTRGLPGEDLNNVIQGAGVFAPNGQPANPIGSGVLSDHAVRLFECWIAYDFHPCCSYQGCGDECCPDTPKYSPTLSLTIGKLKPFFGLEEYLGNQNEQFVEFNMADLMFDADGDNRLMAAGVQYQAMEDRLYAMAIVTNGGENLTNTTQLDNLPGFCAGFWYDFGGTWNCDRHRWELFGDGVSDIDYSCNPVARVGASADLVMLGRRSIYGDGEAQRYFTTNPQPNGTRLINLLDGGTAAANAPNSPNGSHGVDGFDVYTYNVFAAAKWRGFSFMTEWWFRSTNNFQSPAAGKNNIIYNVAGVNAAGTTTPANYLMPAGTSLFDYGTVIQGGYFVIPKKLEVAARMSYINGDSGNVFGNGKFATIAVPGVTGPVRLAQQAFTQFNAAEEYTVGVNYFFKRHLWKWQTDLGYYTNNPAGEGAVLAGWRAGADGWLLRSQIQMFY